MIKQIILYLCKLALFLEPLHKRMSTISAFYYSQKHCIKFHCRNVFFKRPVNFTLGEQYFSIGERTSFGKFAVITAWDSYEGERFQPEVTIGSHCSFGDYLHLTCINKITIGNGVLTGRWVTITDNSHGKSQEIRGGGDSPIQTETL